MNPYLYVDPSLRSFGSFGDERLAAFTERHQFHLPTLALTRAAALRREVARAPVAGVVFGLAAGMPGRAVLRLAAETLRSGRSVFLYWPSETAIEVIDPERLGSLWRHWFAYNAGRRLLAGLRRLRSVQSRPGAAARAPIAAEFGEPSRAALDFVAADFESTKAHLLGAVGEVRRLVATAASIESRLGALREPDGGAEGARADLLGAVDDLGVLRAGLEGLGRHMESGETALLRVGVNLEGLRRGQSRPAPPAERDSDAIEAFRRALAVLRSNLAPAPFPPAAPPTPEAPIEGVGVYLRTDYWAQLISGGSYGHTCYVARELATLSRGFACLMGSHYALLDELGLTQEVIRPPFQNSSEGDLLGADAFYYRAFRARLERLAPAFLYERACLGNFAGARLSRELGIPYLVEYNGSELSMRRSFGSGPYVHEELFLEAEELAFRQATAITVISDHVRDDVVRRGVDPAKVLVNPNGVDCEEYAPADADQRREIRAALDLGDEPVVGFVGTFGGWHGIDVLAAALPIICEKAAEAKFLLIGDGNLKPMMIDAIRRHGLQRRVVDVGRTEQRAGARLLKAADIFVAPHASHMVDSPFFGSPTKLFEYMALGGGIVASDLEQIGVVMSPALRPDEFSSGRPVVGAERGVLCRPGDVDDFVSGVLALLRHRDVAAALGHNARAAALAHYSWRAHVARIWDHVAALRPPAPGADCGARRARARD